MKEKINSIPSLSERLSHWRWQVPLLIIVSLLILEISEHWAVQRLPLSVHETVENGLLYIEILMYVVFFPLLIWWGLTFLQKSLHATEAAQLELHHSHSALETANRRLHFLAEVNHRLAAAEDEETLHDEITQLAYEVSGAAGCTTVLFDDRGKPARIALRGELAPEVISKWDSHISMNHDRGEVCETCREKTGTEPADCPLLSFQPDDSHIRQIYCLALARGQEHYGMVNLYFTDTGHFGPDEHNLLKSVATEMSLALESHRLRGRELETLHRLEHTRRRENLRETLDSLLVDLNDAFGSNGGAIYLYSVKTEELELVAETGQHQKSEMALIRSLAGGALQSNTPLIVSEPGSHSPDRSETPSLLAAPIKTKDVALGVLILRAASPGIFNRRRVRTLTTITGQIALLVDNHRLYAKAEYQAMRAERARLAREIHDGLAQTLGFLKLRTSQMANWLESGQIPRVTTELQSFRKLLEEAYADTREAIDGLRIQPDMDQGLKWIHQVADEFQALSNIAVELNVQPTPMVPVEVQLQLQRIIQEALSNVRKHAQASRIQIGWACNDGILNIRVADNGRGFDLNDVPSAARHGVQIMRERAGILGATFELISQWDKGTEVKVSLPVGELERSNG